jgi:hypothetical protein
MSRSIFLALWNLPGRLITGNRQPDRDARTWKDRSCSVISAMQIPRRARAFPPIGTPTRVPAGRAHRGEPIVHVVFPTAQEFSRRMDRPRSVLSVPSPDT